MVIEKKRSGPTSVSFSETRFANTLANSSRFNDVMPGMTPRFA